MNGEPLNVSTFAEKIRRRMNKKAQIKKFDTEMNLFQSDDEAEQKNIAVDLSQIYLFYKLLNDSITYTIVESDEDGIPDIDSSMASQLKNGKREIHQKIKEIAQRKGMKALVTAYFDANLIPNITSVVRQSVLDDINALVCDSIDVKNRKRDALRQAYEQKKSGAAYLAEVWLFVVCNGINKKGGHSLEGTAKPTKLADPLETIKNAEALLAVLPEPKQVKPPEHPLAEEQIYICELYAAYGNKEGIANFCEEHLQNFDEYSEDLKERRIDYFAAETIRRGIRELYSGCYANQFDVLKDETYAGVRNTAQKDFTNGYEKMLSVMEQAVLIKVTQYKLSPSPNWISNRIVMGVCHFLVNDKKLKWVK